jgi:hypothetical protein
MIPAERKRIMKAVAKAKKARCTAYILTAPATPRTCRGHPAANGRTGRGRPTSLSLRDMPEQEEPPKLDYFANSEPSKSSATRKAVSLCGFIAFGSVALLFCVHFVAIIMGGGVRAVPLIILVGFVAAFLIWLAVREFRNFLR